MTLTRKKLEGQHTTYDATDDLCVRVRGIYTDIVRSDVDGRWSVIKDHKREPIRFNTRLEAVQSIP
jgi:hypothetical protein